MREKVYASQCSLILENGGDLSSNLSDPNSLSFLCERKESLGKEKKQPFSFFARKKNPGEKEKKETKESLGKEKKLKKAYGTKRN